MGADDSNDSDSSSIVASDLVQELNGCDVLMGRSVPKTKCPGNGIFRKLISNNGDEYRSLNKNVYKDEIARRIMLTIRALGGRFLRPIESPGVRKRLEIDGTTEVWVEVDEETSLQKIKQALRDYPYNSKQHHVPKLTTETFEPVPRFYPKNRARLLVKGKAPLYLTQNDRSLVRLYRQGIGKIGRFPFRSQQVTKLENILSHRKNEYVRVHNLTISRQIRLLKQHQGRRLPLSRDNVHPQCFRRKVPVV